MPPGGITLGIVGSKAGPAVLIVALLLVAAVVFSVFAVHSSQDGNGSDDGDDGGEMRLMHIAEDDGKLFMLYKGEGKAGNIESIYIAYSAIPAGKTLKDVYGNYSGTPDRVETISTVDGKVPCNVYISTYKDSNNVDCRSVVYIGVDNGMMYLSEEYEGGVLSSKLTLSKYL
jgi:hypothetical protein